MNHTQARMARAALKLGIRDVAKALKVAPLTITQIERGEHTSLSILTALEAHYKGLGIVFLQRDKDGPGVRLKDVP